MIFPEPNFRSPTISIPYLPYGGGCYVRHQAPTSWKKQQILDRVLLSEQEQEIIVDVDVSYTHRKYECLKEAEEQDVSKLYSVSAPSLAALSSTSSSFNQTFPQPVQLKQKQQNRTNPCNIIAMSRKAPKERKFKHIISPKRAEGLYDRQHNPKELQVGTTVLNENTPHKQRKGGIMDDRWLGPYILLTDALEEMNTKNQMKIWMLILKRIKEQMLEVKRMEGKVDQIKIMERKVHQMKIMERNVYEMKRMKDQMLKVKRMYGKVDQVKRMYGKVDQMKKMERKVPQMKRIYRTMPEL
ncbi:hypothetical protein EMCRGX_G006185 [Ephydatia muelleri]